MTKLSTNTLYDISTTVSFTHFKFCMPKTNFHHTSLSHPLQDIVFIFIKVNTQLPQTDSWSPAFLYLDSPSSWPLAVNHQISLRFIRSCLSLLRVLVQKLFCPSLNVFQSLLADIPTFFLPYKWCIFYTTTKVITIFFHIKTFRSSTFPSVNTPSSLSWERLKSFPIWIQPTYSTSLFPHFQSTFQLRVFSLPHGFAHSDPFAWSTLPLLSDTTWDHMVPFCTLEEAPHLGKCCKCCLGRWVNSISCQEMDVS